jgi:hypothetical protein
MRACELCLRACTGNHDYGDNCDHAESEPPGCSTAGREFYSPLHQACMPRS